MTELQKNIISILIDMFNSKYSTQTISSMSVLSRYVSGNMRSNSIIYLQYKDNHCIASKDLISTSGHQYVLYLHDRTYYEFLIAYIPLLGYFHEDFVDICHDATIPVLTCDLLSTCIKQINDVKHILNLANYTAVDSTSADSDIAAHVAAYSAAHVAADSDTDDVANAAADSAVVDTADSAAANDDSDIADTNDEKLNDSSLIWKYTADTCANILARKCEMHLLNTVCEIVPDGCNADDRHLLYIVDRKIRFETYDSRCSRKPIILYFNDVMIRKFAKEYLTLHAYNNFNDLFNTIEIPVDCVLTYANAISDIISNLDNALVEKVDRLSDICNIFGELSN